MEIGNGSTSITSPVTGLTINTWYQVVGVWTNVATNAFALYINGSLIGSNSHSVTSIKNTTSPLYIGSFNGGQFDQWLNGGMGVVRMYDSALTASQVLQNFNADKDKYIPVTPTPTPTVTPTNTQTPTPTVTPTSTVTPTNTVTPTITPTITITPSITPSTSVGVTFSQTFTGATAPGTAIENEWTTFRSQLTGTYTKFDFFSSNGQGYTGITDSVKVQQLADALRTGTTGTNFSTTISGVTWNIGCCTCRAGGPSSLAVEFANIALCAGSSTAALRPFINNTNWGGIGTTTNAATQTLTLKFY
jgi:hypothetical protein